MLHCYTINTRFHYDWPTGRVSILNVCSQRSRTFESLYYLQIFITSVSITALPGMYSMIWDCLTACSQLLMWLSNSFPLHACRHRLLILFCNSSRPCSCNHSSSSSTSSSGSNSSGLVVINYRLLQLPGTRHKVSQIEPELPNTLEQMCQFLQRLLEGEGM